MKIIESKNAPKAIGPYSQAIVHNGLVYTSGAIPLNVEGQIIGATIEEQTTQVLENLKAVLQTANSNLESVIKTTVFLNDMDNFMKFNKVYEEYFTHHKPARSTVAVKTLPKNVLVEIECIAKIL